MSFKYTFFCIAGHWQGDPGAIGVKGRRENKITLKLSELIAERVQQLARVEDLEYVHIWKDDFKDNLATVISKIRSQIKAQDFILDCHLNSSSNPKASGTESVVNNNASRRSRDLGSAISDIASRVMGIPNRGLKEEKDTPRKKLGITNLAGACVVWEASFISSQVDQDNLDKWMHWVCEEVARIVIKDAKDQCKKSVLSSKK